MKLIPKLHLTPEAALAIDCQFVRPSASLRWSIAVCLPVVFEHFYRCLFTLENPHAGNRDGRKWVNDPNELSGKI